jgi:hypothetical protein
LLFRDAIVDGKLDAKGIEVVYDNTFVTDKYGLKLGAIVGTRSDGSSVLYGVTWMPSEDRDSFTYVLRCLEEVVGAPPGVLLSDGDLRFAEAVSDEFGPHYEQTHHFLCIWHLAQNVFKHVAHVFGAASQGKRGSKEGMANHAKWHDVNRAFWRIAKKSDWQSIRTFSAEFEEIRGRMHTS